MAASRETKNATKAPFHCHSQEIFYRFPSAAKGSEGFQRASGKPFGRLRRGEILCETEKARRPFSLPSTRNPFLVETPICIKRWAPKVSKGRSESPLVASAEAKPSAKQRKARELFFLAFHKKSVSCGRFRPPAGGRGTFPARESTQRAPGAAKGCMSHGRPRTPVAKLQCTASLAGARPARFTSVPGRATVAFKVGRVAKHANKKDEVRKHKGVSKPRLFA